MLGVLGGLVALFGVVAVRTGQLTVLHGQRLAGLAHRQQERRIDLTPLRGRIVDRRGESLALTVDAESLYIRPADVSGDQEEIRKLATTLELPFVEVQRKAAAKAPFVWLKRQAEPKQVAAVVALDAPGVGTVPEPRRVYPRGSLAAHVIGFAGVDAQGLEGIERYYDELLRPPPQPVEVIYDARGTRMLTTGIADPGMPSGARLELTIDAGLQALVERELARGVASTRARGGSVVVLDPWTGALLAIANLPSFDPNNVAGAAPAARRNRAITDMYEPGSTFKAVLAAAALDLGVISPGGAVFCENGGYRVGRRVVHDHRPHGWLTLADVVKYSSNIGAAKIAESIGRERFHDYVRAFGFGSTTGIDLPGEIPGRIRPLHTWHRLDLVTGSFGQGLAVTPLQMATAFAAIANGGLLLRPYVVRRVIATDGTVLIDRERAVVRRVMRQETAKALTAILRRVVEEDGGTGTLARVPGIAVAGKTGTTQKVDPLTGRYSATARVASFAGFVPADAARVAILVMIDEPETSSYGGVVAAPVFAGIAGAFLAREGIEGTKGQVQEVRRQGGAGGEGDLLGGIPRAGGPRPEV